MPHCTSNFVISSAVGSTPAILCISAMRCGYTVQYFLATDTPDAMQVLRTTNVAQLAWASPGFTRLGLPLLPPGTLIPNITSPRGAAASINPQSLRVGLASPKKSPARRPREGRLSNFSRKYEELYKKNDADKRTAQQLYETPQPLDILPRVANFMLEHNRSRRKVRPVLRMAREGENSLPTMALYGSPRCATTRSGLQRKSRWSGRTLTNRRQVPPLTRPSAWLRKP